MVFSRGRGNGGGGGRGAGSGGGAPGRAGERNKDWVCCSKQCTQSVGKEYVNFGFRMACFQCGGSKDACFGSYVQKGSEPKAAAPTYAELQMRRADADKRKHARRSGAGGNGGAGGGHDAGKAAKDKQQLDDALKRIKELEKAAAAKGEGDDQVMADDGSGNTEIDDSSASDAKARREQIVVAKEKIKSLENMSEAVGADIFGSCYQWEECKGAARQQLEELFTATREAKPIDTQLAASKRWCKRQTKKHTAAVEQEKVAQAALLLAQAAIEAASQEVRDCENGMLLAQAEETATKCGDGGVAGSSDAGLSGISETPSGPDERERVWLREKEELQRQLQASLLVSASAAKVGSKKRGADELGDDDCMDEDSGSMAVAAARAAAQEAERRAEAAEAASEELREDLRKQGDGLEILREHLRKQGIPVPPREQVELGARKEKARLAAAK